MTFIPVADTSVPLTIERDNAAASAWNKGALLVVDANGDYAECGADPVSINAVALSDVGADTSGFNILGQKGFPTGKCQGVLVKGRLFSAEYVGALPAAEGGQYGTVKGADGLWRVDFNEVTTKSVVYVKKVENDPTGASDTRIFVRFLDAVAQEV